MKSIFRKNMKDNRLLALHILIILNKYSTSDYRLYQKEISYYLKSMFGYDVSKITLHYYIDELREKGFIEGKRGVYSKVRLIKE